MIRRNDFPILTRLINGKPLIYFDNAATTQKPQSVIEATSKYYTLYNSNVHRGINPLAEEATKFYENSRDIIAKFINAKREEVIFTRGATESINLVARTWGEANLKKKDIIVLSIEEHHSNIVPWLQLQAKIGFKIVYLPINADGSLDLRATKKIIATPGVKFLSLSYASNVLGLVNPIKKIIKLAKLRGVISLIDASQVMIHLPINATDLACDFLIFSGHKMLGPTGTGILYGKQSLLNSMPPFLGGGDMINSVFTDSFTTNVLPYKFEAGTPNIAGVIGLAAACEYVNKLGWIDIQSREQELTKYFLEKIKDLKFIELIGRAKPKLSVFSLIIDGVHPHDATDLLGQEGIILRAGQHCAQPLHEFLNINATLRASLSFYNTKNEINFFIKKLIELKQKFDRN